ncbi:hypothetical protein JCM10213v2_005308 [Rhodosporidiobolus nylandii]
MDSPRPNCTGGRRSDTVIVPHGDGNEIVFEFLGGGVGSNGVSTGVHRVVQTDGVAAPCNPNGGFDSGVVRVANGTLQGNGPSATFPVTNDTAVLYFADIGEDYSACYQGAVFCVNTDEGGPGACHLAQAAALALGAQYGVSASRAPPSRTSSSASSTAAPASRTSAAATAASASARDGSSAAGVNKVGVLGLFGAAVAGVAALA